MNFNIKSIFNKDQVSILFKLMRLNLEGKIQREEMEIILKELETIVETKAVQRIDSFFEELAETYKIEYTSEW